MCYFLFLIFNRQKVTSYIQYILFKKGIRKREFGISNQLDTSFQSPYNVAVWKLISNIFVTVQLCFCFQNVNMILSRFLSLIDWYTYTAEDAYYSREPVSPLATGWIFPRLGYTDIVFRVRTFQYNVLTPNFDVLAPPCELKSYNRRRSSCMHPRPRSRPCLQSVSCFVHPLRSVKKIETWCLVHTYIWEWTSEWNRP